MTLARARPVEAIRPTRAVVDLRALGTNLAVIREASQGAEVYGVIKADAYGHGAVPVARRVGGLTDTIVDGVTGFLFDAYQPAGLETAVRRSIAAYHDSTHWDALVREGMERDFSWGRSAARYQQLYHRAVASRAPTP